MCVDIIAVCCRAALQVWAAAVLWETGLEGGDEESRVGRAEVPANPRVSQWHTHTYTHTGGWGANPRVSQWHTAEGGMRVITWVTVIITIPMCDCEIDSLFSLDVALMFFYFISKMCVCICFHRTFPFSKCMLLNKCYGMVLIHNHYLFLVCRAVPLERIFRRDSQLTCLEKVSEWEFQISSLTLCITWWRVNE